MKNDKVAHLHTPSEKVSTAEQKLSESKSRILELTPRTEGVRQRLEIAINQVNPEIKDQIDAFRETIEDVMNSIMFNNEIIERLQTSIQNNRELVSTDQLLSNNLFQTVANLEQGIDLDEQTMDLAEEQITRIELVIEKLTSGDEYSSSEVAKEFGEYVKSLKEFARQMDLAERAMKKPVLENKFDPKNPRKPFKK